VLSIASAAAGHGGYYLDLARSDYYLEAGEPPGRWAGSGASAVGLTGIVSRDAFESLLAGELPDGHSAVQFQLGKTHKAGYDLTFSLPKSVSAVWAVASDETRRRIEELVDQAIDQTLEYLEDTAAFSRRGRGGLTLDRARLIAAKFLHGSSRNLDPHLHVHVFVTNVCVREDGTTGALYGPALFRAKMAAGALFRAELAHLIETELGLATVRDRASFRIEDVPADLVDRWSSRRHAIEEALARKGLSTAKAAAVAALDTRGEKVILPRAELYLRWQKEALAYGLTEDTVRSLQREVERVDPTAELKTSTALALTRITNHQSHFSERELVRFAAEEAQGRGVGADALLREVKEVLSTSAEVVRLGTIRGEVRYTTREILALEERLLGLAEASRGDGAHVVSMGTVSQVLASRPTVTGEQAAALIHVTRAAGGIQVVSGMAGTGKTYLLAAVREAFERDGFKVVGAALAGKAARGLEEGAGIRSTTLHSLLARLEAGDLSFDARSVLVLDEAGMVGTRQMEAVVRAVREAGGRVVLVGDARQLQPIEHGGPFAALGRLLGEASLVQIQRQKDEWAREAVKDIAAGCAGLAVREFIARGLFHVSDDRELAMGELIRVWREEGLTRPDTALIFAATNREARDLNRLAQAERRQGGSLGEPAAALAGDLLHVHDRVMFTRNSRALGVMNGDLGTVLKLVGENLLVVRLDSSAVVTVPLADYEHLRLGYCLTAHKGQGVTCDRAYVLLGDEMQDLHLSYVQASRARTETHLFTDRVSAGDELSDLVRGMQQERQKTLAHDVADESSGLKRLARAVE
jgi:Ti-type conjugative transfer relaxase TraA